MTEYQQLCKLAYPLALKSRNWRSAFEQARRENPHLDPTPPTAAGMRAETAAQNRAAKALEAAVDEIIARTRA